MRILNKRLISILIVSAIVTVYNIVAMPEFYKTSSAATKSIGFDAKKHLPNVTSQNKETITINTDKKKIIPISGLKKDATSAFVRVSVENPRRDTFIYSNGMDVLSVGINQNYSTTFLTTLIDGGINLYSDSQVEARVEVIASFENSNEPGSIHGVRPVKRVDTMEDLGGQKIDDEELSINVTGKSGVPSTGVRGVFYTISFDTASESSSLFVNSIPNTFPYKGNIHYSSFAVVDEKGNIKIKYHSDDPFNQSIQLKLFVSGYVLEAQMGDEAVNTNGSFIPHPDSSPISLNLKENNPTTFYTTKPNIDSIYSLLLVQTKNYTGEEPTTLDLGDDYFLREQGILVPDKKGSLPQMFLVKMGDDSTKALLHNSSADVEIFHLGDIVGNEEENRESNTHNKFQEAYKSNQMDLQITSPREGDTLKFLDKRKITLDGTIEENKQTLKSVQVFVDDQGPVNIGGAKIRYTNTGIKWTIDIGAPRSGHYTFTVIAQDFQGHKITKQVTVFIEMYDRNVNKMVLMPNTVKIDDPAKYKTIGKDYLDMDCDDQIQVGSVIFSMATAKTKKGLVRIVDSIDRLYDKCRYNTTDGKIEDAVQNLDIKKQIDITGAITDKYLESLKNTEAIDENGNTLKGVKIQEASIVDSDTTKIKSGDQIIDNTSQKTNYCDETMVKLDSNSNCKIANKVTLLGDNGDNSQTTDTPQDTSTSPQDPTGGYIPNGDETNSDDTNSNGDSSTSLKELSLPNGDYFGNNLDSLKKDKTALLGLFASSNYNELSLQGLQDPSLNSLDIINWDHSTSVKSPTLKLKFNIDSETSPFANLFAGAKDSFKNGKTDDQMKAGVKIKFTLDYEKDIKFIVDAGIKVYLGFPGWKFWKIHGELDAHVAFGTEDVTDYSLDIQMAFEFTYKFKFPPIEIPIFEGIISGEFSFYLELKVSINAYGTFKKSNYSYSLSGIRFHNFSFSKINDKKNEVYSEEYSIYKMDVSIELAFVIELGILVLEIIKIEVVLKLGIKLILSLESFIPPGTSTRKLKGGLEIDFLIKADLKFGLDFKIWELMGTLPIFDFTIPLMVTTFTPTIPSTNIGKVIIDTGKASGIHNFDFDYLDKNNSVIYLLLRKNKNGVYIPNPMVNITTNGSTSSSEDTQSGFWTKDSDYKNLLNSEEQSKCGSLNDFCDLLYSGKIPSKTSGIDGIGHIVTGNNLQLADHKVPTDSFTNSIIKENDNSKLQYFKDALDNNLENANTEKLGVILPMKQRLDNLLSESNLNSEDESLISLSQLGFIAPNDAGKIEIEFLNEGDYKLIPIFNPPKTSFSEPFYSFNIQDWGGSDMISGWDKNFSVATLQVPLRYDFGFTVSNFAFNTTSMDSISNTSSTEIKDGVNYKNIYEDLTSNEILVKKGDIVDSTISIDIPSTNGGNIINPKLVLKNSDPKSDGLIFNSQDLGEKSQSISCQFYKEDGSEDDVYTYSKTGNNILVENNNEYTVDLGFLSEDSYTYKSGVGSSKTLQANAKILPNNGNCTINFLAKAGNSGYYQYQPTLTYDFAPLSSYTQGGIYKSTNYITKGINADYSSSFESMLKIQGSLIEVYQGKVYFSSVQKYTYPIMPVSETEWHFVKRVGESYYPVAVSSLSTDQNSPYGPNNIPSTCSKPTNGGLDGLSSCLYADVSGSIDIEYLTPGDYKLILESAPNHYKQTGITVSFTIIKPTPQNPNIGIVNQGYQVIPPEIYLESNAKLDPSFTKNPIKTSDRQDFTTTDTDEDNPVTLSGSYTDYKSSPGEKEKVDYEINYPLCEHNADNKCNFSPIAMTKLLMTANSDDVQFENSSSIQETTHSKVNANDDNYQTKTTTLNNEVETSGSDYVQRGVGTMSCAAIPNQVTTTGSVIPKKNDPQCQNLDNNEYIHFEYLPILSPGTSYKLSIDYNSKLWKNQTINMDATITSSDGVPSTGTLNAIRLNRGYGAIFIKEDNSFPNDLTVSGMTQGIPLEGVDISLYKKDGSKVTYGTTMDSSISPKELYTIYDTAKNNWGVFRVEDLDEGSYYFKVDNIPINFYQLDPNIVYPFDVVYERLGNTKQRATDIKGNQLLKDWYLTNTGIANYTPKLKNEPKIDNLIYNSSLLDDKITKESDLMKYSNTLTYDSSVNRGNLYKPYIFLRIPSNIDTTNSIVSVKYADQTISTFKLNNEETQSIPIGRYSSKNFGENRLGITPKDIFNVEFLFTQKDNTLAKIQSYIQYELLNDDYQEQTATISEFSNTSYPGHVEFRVGERWAKNRFIENVAFALYKNNVQIGQYSTDSLGKIVIDYLEEGNYKLVPIVDKLPKGYTLNDDNMYQNDNSKNSDSYEKSHTEMTFSIDSYKKESPTLSVNLGTFELYYKPNIDTNIKVRNLSRSGEIDPSLSTMIKPGDDVEYTYTINYNSLINSGILHSPKISLSDNSMDSLIIDPSSLETKVDGKVYEESDQTISVDDPTNTKELKNEGIEFSEDLKSISLPDNLLPASSITIKFLAKVYEVDEVNLKLTLSFDHLYNKNRFNENVAPIFRSTLITTVTELHSIGTRFLKDSKFELLDEKGNLQPVDNTSSNGIIYSELAVNKNNEIDSTNSNNLLILEYLPQGKYSLKTLESPKGYLMPKDNKYFNFEVKEFDASKYSNYPYQKNYSTLDDINGDKEQENSRVFDIDEPYSTIAFDYVPNLDINTFIRNSSRGQKEWTASSIMKKGDQYDILVHVKYDDTKNKGIVYGANILDDINTSSIVYIKDKDSNDWNDSLDWDDEKIQFGVDGTLSDADNNEKRLYPGDEYYFTYRQTYLKEEMLDENIELSHLYSDSTQTSSVNKYFGTLELSSLESFIDDSRHKLEEVEFKLEKSGSFIPVFAETKMNALNSPDALENGDFISDTSGLSKVNYLENGTYTLSIQDAPSGNIFDKNFKYIFEISNTSKKEAPEPIILPVRYVKFIAKTTKGDNLKGVSSVVLTQENPSSESKNTPFETHIVGGNLYQINGILSKDYDPTNSYYTTDDFGEILFDHFPSGTYSIMTVKSATNYEHTTSPITKPFTIVNNTITENNPITTKTIINSHNKELANTKISQFIKNVTKNLTVKQEKMEIMKNDLLDYWITVKLPEKISYGSYQNFSIELIKSGFHNLHDKANYIDVYMNDSLIPFDKYKVDESDYSFIISFDSNYMPFITSSSNLKVGAQYSVDTTSSNPVSLYVQTNANSILKDSSKMYIYPEDYKIPHSDDSSNPKNETVTQAPLKHQEIKSQSLTTSAISKFIAVIQSPLFWMFFLLILLIIALGIYVIRKNIK